MVCVGRTWIDTNAEEHATRAVNFNKFSSIFSLSFFRCFPWFSIDGNYVPENTIKKNDDDPKQRKKYTNSTAENKRDRAQQL